MKNYEYHVLFLESFFNVSLDTRNFYYLTKNSFTFFIIKRKQNLQNKQVETNCWNLKLNTQQITTSCKIKYFSAYLLQSIVIKFILPPFPKKLHQAKISSNENLFHSFALIDHERLHTRTRIFHIVFHREIQFTRTRIKFFYSRSQS